MLGLTYLLFVIKLHLLEELNLSLDIFIVIDGSIFDGVLYFLFFVSELRDLALGDSIVLGHFDSPHFDFFKLSSRNSIFKKLIFQFFDKLKLLLHV